MAYTKNTMISRAPRGGIAGVLGSFTDTVGDIAKGAVTFFGSQQRAAGQAEALAATNAQLLAANTGKSAGGGVDTTTLLIGGAAVAGLAFILMRKKS